AQRLEAAKWLGRYGTAAKDAAPALGLMLRDDTAVANEAAAALARLGPPPPPPPVKGPPGATPPGGRGAPRARAGARAAGEEGGVPTLLLALNDRRPQTRALAAQALGEIGADTARAVPALCLALRDPDPAVRRDAGLALVNLGPAAVAGLRDALRDEDAALRR